MKKASRIHFFIGLVIHLWYWAFLSDTLIFQKCYPHKVFGSQRESLFFRIFLLGHISDAYRFQESHLNYLIFYFLLVFRYIHIFSFQYLSWCDFAIISSRKWPKIQILEVFSIFRQPLWIFWKLWKTHFEYFVYIFWIFFDLLNLRALSKVEKRLLTLEIWNLATLVVKFLSPCHLQIVQLPLKILTWNFQDFLILYKLTYPEKYKIRGGQMGTIRQVEEEWLFRKNWDVVVTNIFHKV